MTADRQSLFQAREGMQTPCDPHRIAWLIERGQDVNHAPTVWWSGNQEIGWGGWTTDPNEALSFLSRKEAERYAEAKWMTTARYGPSYTITEHIFVSPPGGLS